MVGVAGFASPTVSVHVPSDCSGTSLAGLNVVTILDTYPGVPGRTVTHT